MLPIFGAMAVGIILVIVGGWLLGNYITRPINMLEEGLLAILNGQADKRFELDHAELGGLAFRIDQLLNQLMGVEEDTTDAEGRVSMAPNAANFNDALSVDDKRMTQAAGEMTMDPEAVRRLAAEPAPAQYYARIYREYIAAKRAIGEPTDHITEQAFAARIQGMEQEAAQKYGQARALPGPGAEQRGRPARCSLAVARSAALRGQAVRMGLFDLFKGGDKKSTEEQPGRQVGRPHREARAELRPAGGHPGPVRDGDGRRGRGAAQALHLPHGPVDHGPGGEGRRRSAASYAPGKDAIEPVRAFAAKAESLAWPMKIMKELVDERRVRRGAAALAVAVGHRVRQVRRPEGADPRRARGAQAPEHPRRRSSDSSRT